MIWDTTQNIYTKYYYDGLTVIAESKKVGSGSWSWGRVMTASPGVIGNILCIIDDPNGNYYEDYYHYDALGNLAMTTMPDSTPNLSYEQEAYGNVKVGYQSGYHLTTKEYDSHPQLYYFWQRWYDPLLGRFISKAPYPPHIEHPYIYVNNNPINLVDSNGYKSMHISMGIIGDYILEWFTRINACALGWVTDYGPYLAGRNDLSDKEKHCILSCLISQDCGYTACSNAGLAKEIWDIIGKGESEVVDLIADYTGCEIGQDSCDEEECWDRCSIARDSGLLPDK